MLSASRAAERPCRPLEYTTILRVVRGGQKKRPPPEDGDLFNLAHRRILLENLRPPHRQKRVARILSHILLRWHHRQNKRRILCWPPRGQRDARGVRDLHDNRDYGVPRAGVEIVTSTAYC